MRFVDEGELRRCVPMTEAIEAVREAYVAYATGEFERTPRVAAPSRTLFAMLAERQPANARLYGQAIKIVSYHEHNPEAGRPMVQGVVVWFDGETGEPALAIDGAAVTSLRTGAASGVASDLFADPEASSLAVLGTGAIAADQIRAVCAVRPIRKIAVVGRNHSKASALARSLEPEFPEAIVEAPQSVSDALRGADIVCTATTATSPLFTVGDVGARVHINAVGSFTPAMCEFGPDVVGAAKCVYVDELSALEDAGELVSARAQNRLSPDSVSLIGNALRGDRFPVEGGITIFKSIGIAAQDWAIANRVAAATAPA